MSDKGSQCRGLGPKKEFNVKTPRWVSKFFHFGTENGEEQSEC